MDDATLLTICGTAFVAVFVLLTVLSLVIQLITVAFPSREETGDPALAAAICTAVATLYPGARVTAIEEKT